MGIVTEIGIHGGELEKAGKGSIAHKPPDILSEQTLDRPGAAGKARQIKVIGNTVCAGAGVYLRLRAVVSRGGLARECDSKIDPRLHIAVRHGCAGACTSRDRNDGEADCAAAAAASAAARLFRIQGPADRHRHARNGVRCRRYENGAHAVRQRHLGCRSRTRPTRRRRAGSIPARMPSRTRTSVTEGSARCQPLPCNRNSARSSPISQA